MNTPCEYTPRAIIFDFDGTIVDSMETFADIAADVMPKRLNIDKVTARRLYLETSGLPFFQQLEVLFPGDPANQATAEEFERLKLDGYLDKPLYDDTEETIAHLRAEGWKTIVSSNNFQHLVERYLQHTKVAFDMVLGYQPGFDKGPAHFAHIEQTARVRRSQMIFVGDSIKDGERADAFDIDFIGKEGTFTREQFQQKFPKARVISTLSELKTIL